jgi:hypothetical protein
MDGPLLCGRRVVLSCDRILHVFRVEVCDAYGSFGVPTRLFKISRSRISKISISGISSFELIAHNEIKKARVSFETCRKTTRRERSLKSSQLMFVL